MKIGSNDITDVKIGTTNVSEIRLGTTLIWQRAAPMMLMSPPEEEMNMVVEEDVPIQEPVTQSSFMSKTWNFITNLFKFR